MRLVAAMAATALLAACGGGGGGGRQPERTGGDACDAYAKSQLGDKTYQLDKAALAASMVPAADGVDAAARRRS